MARRFLFVVDENGDEIAGTRQDITNIADDWRACHQAEGELRRLIGEDCEIVDVVEERLSPNSYARRAGLFETERSKKEFAGIFV